MVTKDVRWLIEIAVLNAMIAVLEMLFWILPNVSLTPLLMAIYFRHNKALNAIIFILVYLQLQWLVWGFGFYLFPMFLGFFFWFLMIRQAKSQMVLTSTIFGSVYGLTFMPFYVIIHRTSWWWYLMADIPFQIIMSVSTAMTMLWLYPPLERVYLMYKEVLHEKIIL